MFNYKLSSSINAFAGLCKDSGHGHAEIVEDLKKTVILDLGISWTCIYVKLFLIGADYSSFSCTSLPDYFKLVNLE